jgi:hypothetical protein
VIIGIAYGHNNCLAQAESTFQRVLEVGHAVGRGREGNADDAVVPAFLEEAGDLGAG